MSEPFHDRARAGPLGARNGALASPLRAKPRGGNEDNLKPPSELQRAWIVYPGTERYGVHEKVDALPLTQAASVFAALACG